MTNRLQLRKYNGFLDYVKMLTLSHNKRYADYNCNELYVLHIRSTQIKKFSSILCLPGWEEGKHCQ